MRTIVWFCYFWGSLLLLIPKLRRAQKLDAAGETAQRDALVEREVHNWCASLLRLAGVDITVTGRENLPDGPAVYVANHQGNFDIPLMLTLLPRPAGLAAKIELARLPLIRSWMKLLGCVFLDRGNPRQSVAALGEAAERLQSGYSFIVFPEGHRSKGGPMGEFKGGAFKMALRSKTPVVPVCISGSWKVMEQQGFWIRPASVSLQVLPAIDTASLSREEARTLPGLVQQQIRDCLEPASASCLQVSECTPQ